MFVWLLVLHIAALLFWAGALLYLPALIAATDADPHALVVPERRQASLARFVFTAVATPAAVASIIAGTLVFLVDRNVEPWLLVKLTLVTLLVMCHAVAGLLVLRAERAGAGGLRLPCALLAGVSGLLMAGIFWIVLAKPQTDLLPWVG